MSCRRSSRFWGLGCPKIFHEIEDSLVPESTWARVEQLLREDWSPEQISGWLTREEGVSVSHERIYQHVYEDKRRGGDLHRHLRCQKPRRKRYGHYDRRGQIRERVSIDERPEVVEARSRIGDWEADTVIGKLARMFHEADPEVADPTFRPF